MKKSSIVNLIIVCCLLTLCITTLIVIYAAAPETSVVLFEENFDTLDESKWTHETAECKEDKSESLFYTGTNNENRYTADGKLHIFTTHMESPERLKRGAQPQCNSCINWQNGAVDCFSTKFSARLQTKASFDVDCGQIEVRSRLPSDHRSKLSLLIVPVKNESKTDAVLGGFVISKTSEQTGANCSAGVQIFFGPGSNQSEIKSALIDNDFHSYKIQWDNLRVVFALDGQIIFEKALPVQGNYSSCTNEGPSRNRPINQPFYIQMGVDMGEIDLKCHQHHSDQKRSLTELMDDRDSSVADVDYIRFTKILT